MVIRNLTTGETIADKVEICDTFWKRGRGLMFRRPLAEREALLFVLKREGVAKASIHMFFVFFRIGVIWLDGEKRVVSKTLAQPFRPHYAPQRPSRYFIECHPRALDQAQIGDVLAFEQSSI